MIEKLGQIQKLYMELEEEINNFQGELERQVSGLQVDVNEWDVKKEKTLELMADIEKEQENENPDVYMVKSADWEKLKELIR